MSLTGADLLVQEFERQGVRCISTLCGNGLNHLLVSCRKAGIRLIDTHNEQAAAYMADAYARLTGRVGVCAVSSGVAHCNALTGAANAFFDGAPMLLITGASAGYGAGRGAFQEFDQVALAAPICKLATSVRRPGDIISLVRQAFDSALSGRPGPVHLTIPVDLLAAELDDAEAAVDPVPSASVRGEEADITLVREAAQALERSRCPLLIAGSGVFYAGSQAAMLGFSEAWSVPMVTPIWDRGAVDGPHPNFLGVVGAASGEPRLLEDADLIILAGAAADYRVGFLVPPKVKKDAFVIRIDTGTVDLEQSVSADISFSAGPVAVFRQLTEAMPNQAATGHAKWLEDARERRRLFYARWAEQPFRAADPVNGRHIVEAIRPLLSEDVIFLVDGGNIGQWAHVLLAADRYPGHWLTCGASAVVGWGLPGAMAAKAAYPDRPVLLLSGDGAFGFTVAELESAVRHGLSFVAVVADDSAWGIVASGQRQQFGQDGVIASQFGRVRYDDLARAFGARGVRAEDARQLAAAIRDGFRAEFPTVIHVPIAAGGPADFG